jgi:glycerol kinase
MLELSEKLEKSNNGLRHATDDWLVSALDVGKIQVTDNSNAMHKRMVTIASSPLILR